MDASSGGERVMVSQPTTSWKCAYYQGLCRSILPPSSLFYLCFCPLHQYTMSSNASETVVEKYRYEILFGAWLAVTGATFLRIKRQPYSTRLKIEQYESIFKGTSLGAVLIGIGITPARTTARRFSGN
jgi:hypothetical protein